MRHLVISDLHGRAVSELDQIIEGEGIGSLICLGDFDQVKVIRSVIDLEDRFREEGKQTLVVPGNHDSAVLDNLPIHSGTLHQQGKDIWGLHQELKQDPVALNYLSRLLGEETNGKEIILGKDCPTYVVHGGLGGSLASHPRCPEKWQDLWFRIDYGGFDYPSNFVKMGELGYKILLRGHDHHRMYGFEVEEGKSGSVPVSKGGKFGLVESDKHVITSGAWFEGDYLIIDDSDNKLTLDFRNIKS
jgi:predicted phosphodiesterase